MLLLEIRKEIKTIKKLLEEVQLMEENNNNTILLDNKKKKKELESRIKLKGAMIRSKAKWISDGEKPSKYFCSLENRNFT